MRLLGWFRRKPQPTEREVRIARIRQAIEYTRRLDTPRDRMTMLNLAAHLRRQTPPMPVHDAGEFLFY